MTVDLLIWAFLPEERARARMDQRESKSYIHQRASSGYTAAWDSLQKNVSKAVVLKLFQEEAPLHRVNYFVPPPPKENSWRKHPQTYNFTYKF